MGFFEFIQNHFMHVLPILLAGGFAIAIIGERAHALFVVYPIRNTAKFLDRITELVAGGKTAEAVALCDQSPSKPAAQVVKQALIRAHQPEPIIEHGISAAVGDWSDRIQRRTGFLATIANVATLLGLFGTILGLIQSFQAVGHADAQQKSELLAQGIATAMNATMLGLGVAIPCMVAFAFLVNRANRLVAETEHTAIRTLEILKARFYGFDEPATESAHEAKDNGSEKTGRKAKLALVGGKEAA